jgi:hypothetical protein
MPEGTAKEYRTMFHRTFKTAAACLTVVLLAGFGPANAMSPAAPSGAPSVILDVAQYGNYNRTYGYQGRSPQAYGYDARGEYYGRGNDEIDALQYVYPQTYGWPRGTENQF